MLNFRSSSYKALKTLEGESAERNQTNHWREFNVPKRVKVCPSGYVWKTFPAKTNTQPPPNSKVKVRFLSFLSGWKKQEHIPDTVVCVLCVFVHTPAAATAITQVATLVVVVFVCCILHCGSKETSVVTVGVQTTSAPLHTLLCAWLISVKMTWAHITPSDILPNSRNADVRTTPGWFFTISTGCFINAAVLTSVPMMLWGSRISESRERLEILLFSTTPKEHTDTTTEVFRHYFRWRMRCGILSDVKLYVLM